MYPRRLSSSSSPLVTGRPISVHDTKASRTMTEPVLNPSFVLQSPGHLSYEDRQVPELQSPYDVLVEPQWTGICGSDV